MPGLSRVVESMLLERVHAKRDYARIFGGYQTGFMRNSGPTECEISFQLAVDHHSSHNRAVAAVHFDAKAAFDSVSYVAILTGAIDSL